MNFKTYLANKPIFYRKIDLNRMPRIYNQVKNKLRFNDVIHIVGTNGKGSTGRYLAQFLYLCGKKVGHFTSPHLLDFSERFYLNTKNVTDNQLQEAHEQLEYILTKEHLDEISYFEYCTFLAVILFKECDFLILEAGMGGEFDSTNVFDKKISVFTPIDIDHKEILGDSIEKISTTKLNSMGKIAIVNENMNQISLKIAHDIANKKQSKIYLSSDILDKRDYENIDVYSKRESLPLFLKSNLTLAFSVLKFLGFSYNLCHFTKLDLPGRMQQISSNITIDVGHNVLGAKAIFREIFPKKVVLVYNAFADKDVDSIIDVLSPIIIRVEILKYNTKYRVQSDIESILKSKNIEFRYFNPTNLSSNVNYLVFGSFVLVENFLKLTNYKI